MPYWLRILAATLAAAFWPPAWWQRIAHLALAAATWFAPELRDLVDQMLGHLGIWGLEDWHYYVGAAVIAIILLAFRIALLTTSKVSFVDLRSIEFDGWHYLKADIENNTSHHLMIMAVLMLKTTDGNVVSLDGRDKFVLLTEQRLVERRKKPKKDYDRKRFNLGDCETKGLEIIAISIDLKKAKIFDELGEVDLPLASYHFEIVVSGGGTPTRAHLNLADLRKIGHIELSGQFSKRDGPRRLYLNRTAQAALDVR